MDAWEKSILGRGNRKCKGPGGEEYLACLRKSELFNLLCALVSHLQNKIVNSIRHRGFCEDSMSNER